MSYIPVIEILA